MPTIRHLSVTLIDNDDKAAPGQLQTTVFAHNDRVQRGLLKLGTFWLLALVSVPIIIAHWVLVPGFFIAGPWMGYRTYKMTQRHDHIDGDCPVCQTTVKIKTEAQQTLPLWTYCPHCNAPLQITPSD